MNKTLSTLLVFFFGLSNPFSFWLSGKNEEPEILTKSQTEGAPYVENKNHPKGDLLRKPLFPGAGQVDLLRVLLDMPPEKLRIMRKTIERVEKMSPVHKKEIKIRLSRLRDLNPENRARELRVLRRRYETLNKHWQNMDSESRQLEMSKFFKLSLSERSKYFNEIKEL